MKIAWTKVTGAGEMGKRRALESHLPMQGKSMMGKEANTMAETSVAKMEKGYDEHTSLLHPSEWAC